MDVMPFDQQQEQRIKQAERIGPELSADQQTPVGATDNVARVQCRFAALVEWTVLEHGTCMFQFFISGCCGFCRIFSSSSGRISAAFVLATMPLIRIFLSIDDFVETQSQLIAVGSTK